MDLPASPVRYIFSSREQMEFVYSEINKSLNATTSAFGFAPGTVMVSDKPKRRHIYGPFVRIVSYWRATKVRADVSRVKHYEVKYEFNVNG